LLMILIVLFITMMIALIRVQWSWTLNNKQDWFFYFQTVVWDTKQQKHKAMPCNSTISWIWK
jgi:hypothetical protein